MADKQVRCSRCGDDRYIWETPGGRGGKASREPCPDCNPVKGDTVSIHGVEGIPEGTEGELKAVVNNGTWHEYVVVPHNTTSAWRLTRNAIKKVRSNKFSHKDSMEAYRVIMGHNMSITSDMQEMINHLLSKMGSSTSLQDAVATAVMYATYHSKRER